MQNTLSILKLTGAAFIFLQPSAPIYSLNFTFLAASDEKCTKVAVQDKCNKTHICKLGFN